MANRARPTLQKREREKARQKKQVLKQERRQEAKARREAAPRRTGDEDPDIAGIRPGPQPREFDGEDASEEPAESE
jgi:hypothetical protein